MAQIVSPPATNDADVAFRLVHVALQVEDRVLVGAERALVLDQRLGRVAIVDAGDQPAPGADGRLEHDRVAELLDCLEGRFGGRSDPGVRGRHPGGLQQAGRAELVPAVLDHFDPVHRRHAAVGQHPQVDEGAAVAERAVEDDIEVEGRFEPARAAEREDDLAVVDQLEVRTPPLELPEQELLFGPDPAVEDTDAHRLPAIRPSPLLLPARVPGSPARAR